MSRKKEKFPKTVLEMVRKGSDIADTELIEVGKKRVDWAGREMPVLQKIKARFANEKPLKGQRISACLHVTTETANLALTLASGGAKVRLCASNPLSTQDDTAAYLAGVKGIEVYAICGETRTVYYDHLKASLEFEPTITMDDGADLVALLHKQYTHLLDGVLCSTEETTTGVIRLKALESAGKLRIPVIAINSAQTKHMFDNRYGTGQSTLDGILRSTNMLIAGKTVVVAGYGWCGRGFAARARGHGAHVVITETDPLKALEAHMDGFSVMPMNKAARQGDLFVTLTGDLNVIDEHHFGKMKDNAVICNSGHFDCEINLKALKKLAGKPRSLRKHCEEYRLPNGRRIIVLAEGRLVNLSAAEGHPASVMDMSFANQALTAELIASGNACLENRVYPVPEEIDGKVARLKLAALGISIDKLTREQKEYLSSYHMGT